MKFAKRILAFCARNSDEFRKSEFPEIGNPESVIVLAGGTGQNKQSLKKLQKSLLKRGVSAPEIPGNRKSGIPGSGKSLALNRRAAQNFLRKFFILQLFVDAKTRYGHFSGIQ